MHLLPARSLPVWGTLALLSLAFGAWLGVQPGRSEAWTSPYLAQWLKVDYPPHALVLLWPLDGLPGDADVWFMAAWPRRHHPDAQLLIASACLLWILLALPNQRYYLILLAPLVWTLVWTPLRFAPAGSTWPAWVAVGLVIFNLLDTPVTLRRIAEHFKDTSPFSLEWLWVGSYIVAGVVVLSCFVMAVCALRRITVPSAR